jgi:hypothetical protein
LKHNKYKNDIIKIIEVKPIDLVNDTKVRLKYESLLLFALPMGIKVEYWTEKELGL